jgi:long-chain acyl-CoA synthetase
MTDSQNLLEAYRVSASEHGARTALQHGARQLSYSELLDAALVFGERLRAEGLDPRGLAVLLLENSLEYVIALLGIWAAGGTAVPLSPETTAGNLGKILSACKVQVLIGRGRVVEQLGAATALPKAIALPGNFDESREWFHGPSSMEGVDSNRTDLAMVLFTSGTTGIPKGVVLTHGNLLANCGSIVKYLELTSEDSIVNVLPFFHSFGNSVLLTHLAVGGKVAIENRFAFPAQVVQVMQTLRPTGFAGVPATYYILTKKTNFLQQDWSFLRYICQAGGGMRMETIRQLRQIMPNTAIYIMYGQTEASARLSYVPPELLEKKIGSIGKGIPDVELRVVNEMGQPVQGDEVGEIIASGPNIMAGYFNDPVGTAETLRDGWLHTGDMARVDEEGFIFVVSRKSDFIKSASYRISPGEIEEVIAAAAPEIEDLAVIGVPDELLGEAVAVCICCPLELFDQERIRSLCRERLPLYKVPKHVIHEAEIPRTKSGKKMYNVLREKYRDLVSTAS